MYKLSKYLDLKDEIVLPETMYRIKPFYTFEESLSNKQSHSAMPGENQEKVKQLEERQDAILSKLSLLKSKVESLSPSSAQSAPIKGQENSSISYMQSLKSQIELLLNPQARQLVEILDSFQSLLKNDFVDFYTEYQEILEESCDESQVKISNLVIELKSQLNEMLSFIGNAFHEFPMNRQSEALLVQKCTSPNTVVMNTDIIDLVISAAPTNPPYSLLYVKKLLNQHGIAVYFTASVHSSIKEKVDPKILEIFQNDWRTRRSEYDYAFTVIYRDQELTSVMVNPLAQSLIAGEENVLRYLSRTLPINKWNYEESNLSTIDQADYWLDTIQANFLNGNTKMRQVFLKQLNGRLGTNKWILGTDCGVCDVFAWSVAHQLKCNSCIDDLPNNVMNWFKNMNNTVGAF